MSLRCWLVIAALMVASACGDGSGPGDDAAPDPVTTEVAAEERTVPSTAVEQPTSTLASTAVPTSADEAVLPISGWEAVPNGTNLWATEIVASDGEFFVVGNEAGPLVQEPRSGVWRSTDGVTWVESLVFPSADPAGPRVAVGDLTVVDGRIVALAQRTDGIDWPRASNKELIAFSTDDRGTSWSETVVHTWSATNFRDLATRPSFAYSDPNVVFVVEGGAGEGGGDDTITGTMMWIRTDEGWDFVDPTESGLAQVWVWAMAATEDGFVAVADIREAVEGFEDCQTQALWTSPDARSWTRVWTNDRDCEWFSINQLITIDGELIGVGNENDVVSCSLDGEGSWDCPPLYAPVRVFRITDQAIEDRPIEPAEFADMFLTDVEINDGVIIATGRAFDHSASHIWLSLDATTWTHADIPPQDLADRDLFQVAVNGDAVIVLGMELTPTGPGNFTTWITDSP